MGWKNVKEFYKIGHIVHVREGLICIGSSYINEIITIDQEGNLIKRYDDRGNEDLLRYQREMEADQKGLRALIEAPDHFDQAITVYVHQDGVIQEKKCEKLGWPNVTYDGELMYENTHSADPEQVRAWAQTSLRCAIRCYSEALEENEKKLQILKDQLMEKEGYLKKLSDPLPKSKPSL